MLLFTRQPPNLRKLLTKFERLHIPKQLKQVGFFPCSNCINHKNGYFKECLSFCSNLKTRHYKLFLVAIVKMFYIYLFAIIVIFFYIGQTEELKQLTRKHKSDAIHPNNSYCKKCSEHLRISLKIKEPYFNIYLFLYEGNKCLREFKERRYIMNWEPQLNSYQ